MFFQWVSLKPVDKFMKCFVNTPQHTKLSFNLWKHVTTPIFQSIFLTQTASFLWFRHSKHTECTYFPSSGLFWLHPVPQSTHWIFSLCTISPTLLGWGCIRVGAGTDYACEAANCASSCADTPCVRQLKHLTVRVAIRRRAQTDVFTRSCQFSKTLADGRRTN